MKPQRSHCGQTTIRHYGLKTCWVIWIILLLIEGDQNESIVQISFLVWEVVVGVLSADHSKNIADDLDYWIAVSGVPLELFRMFREQYSVQCRAIMWKEKPNTCLLLWGVKVTSTKDTSRFLFLRDSCVSGREAAAAWGPPPAPPVQLGGFLFFLFLVFDSSHLC